MVLWGLSRVNSKFTSHHTVRTDRQSGGVSIYTGDYLCSRKLENLCYANRDIEICTVEIIIKKEPIYILGVYRPHSGTIESFCEEIGGILQNPLFRNRRCAIAGDFNINLMQENSENSRFVGTLQSHHFFPVISKPTRFSPNDNCQPSLLDQIWFNSLNIFNSGIISYDITDHCPTFLQFSLPVSQISNDNEFIKITFRISNLENRERYRQVIMNYDWTNIDSDKTSMSSIMAVTF